MVSLVLGFLLGSLVTGFTKGLMSLEGV